MSQPLSPFDLLLATAHDALWQWNPITNEASWGAAWYRLTGRPIESDALPGLEEWQQRLHPDECDDVLDRFDDFLASQEILLELEHRISTDDASYRWVLLRVRCQRDSDGNPNLLVGAFTDISEHKVLDPYTRLPNRIHLLDRLERSLSRLRFGGSHAVGVLCIRIHLPASHADQLSHDEQIELSRILGERISSELRPWDFVAQFEALQFAVLLEMVAAGSDLPTITDRLFQLLRHPIEIGPHQIQIGASIGSADTASVTGNEEHILRAAEDASNLAASHGDFHHIAYTPCIHDQLSQHVQIEQDIVTALIEQQFEPWFQPIVRLEDQAIVGFEALARWPRNGEILQPRQFLPFMERSGMIKQITWIMLQKALEAHEQWIEDKLLATTSHIGINLPADQLQDSDLAEQILALIADMEIPAQRLGLEIQEKNIQRTHPAIRANLELMRLEGGQISIDDSGITPTSLMHLVDFPLDTLKINRLLVAAIESSPSACKVIRNLVVLAKNMGLNITAQGVETRAQLAFLREIGVPQAQGYLFAPALSAADVPQWLANHRKENAPSA